MKRYDPKTIEPKWQKIWADTRIYEVTEDPERNKINASPMLPYPSGAGLHVGHVRNYSIADAVARYYRQRGYNTMTNIGWDAFGLPAENYAIKTGTPPATTTQANINNFKKQLKRLGMSYAWEREFSTADPKYYKWTQWIFTQLFNNGLAYQDVSMQWWCPECKTVLANEQVENGCCWRHEATPVEKRQTKQWFFRITKYADELLDGLEEIDWPERITSQQQNWIGRKHGLDLTYTVNDSDEQIVCFTTRPDTNFGATFIVLAPEHPFVEKVIAGTIGEGNQANAKRVEHYVEQALKKSDLERQEEGHTKTGAFTGFYATNQLSGAKMPIWVSDFVLAGFGTGAVVGVPGHDRRDFQFAKTFELPIKRVVVGPNGERGEITDEEDVQEETGIMMNSGFLDGMEIMDAIQEIKAHIEKEGWGKRKVSYRIRDWLISRQRYWGAPIPIIHCETCGAVPVPDDQLPVKLPHVEDYAPTGETVSVLAGVEDWVNVSCPKCNAPAKRETDTMDGYACSSWYMHRYCDAKNDKMAWDPDKLNYWFPVDFYFGADHAVSHLLYFRFWNHFFVDQGLVKPEAREPVRSLVFNGYVKAEDGRKMSKSLGNVVDPLDVIESGYGADALRMFELFAGPYDQDVLWNPGGVPGTFRFLQRVWLLTQEYLEATKKSDTVTAKGPEGDLETVVQIATHRAIRKVTNDLESFKFNTAIAACMELVNSFNKQKADLPFEQAPQVWRQSLAQLLQLLAPIAPHIAEELWEALGYEQSIHVSGWPNWEEKYVREEILTIVVQVNGKVRANIEAARTESMKSIITLAKKDPGVARHLEDGKLIKTIEVPHKLINFVIKV